MDQRVIRAMELLREAGRLDLIAAPAARRERPVRRAVSGVAAAVAACSPPRGSQQGFSCGSEDGDPGELLTGSKPWEEEAKAGPSTASWTGHHRGGEEVRAKFVVRRCHAGSCSVPTSGMVVRTDTEPERDGGAEKERMAQGPSPLPFLVAETENGHMADENRWEEKKTRQMLIR
ncbi:hypothetical protein NDU88_008834 [Pleurodeles waltl]|uniref:Uncharacterized protein n=1 Tax=Pleurodeles waltl TaxID=8319 RepID=A0AAV7QVW6_PLEWA|nr:hypothetical protein NDU88_008834 [Pleurodeles waltl]